MEERVLFVDDEPAVLDGYRRLLRRDFTVETAVGGEAALASMASGSEYAVVVSDMRMPGMDGVELLTRVKALAPDTQRMVLSGYADVERAISAVNEGSIFRFLTKPSDKYKLAAALNAGLAQFRLIKTEKELLDSTLRESIQVLTEILSLVNPEAFGRTMRIRRYVKHIASKLGWESPWRYEIAAMLSQLGCITLHPDTLAAVAKGEELSREEQSRFDAHSRVARDLLSKIPRMESVAWMISHQNQPSSAAEAERQDENIRLGAEALRLCVALERILARGLPCARALERLKLSPEQFEPSLLAALADLELGAERLTAIRCRVADLYPGMILGEEVRAFTGMLLAAKGQELNHASLARLRSFHRRRAIADELLVLVAVSVRISGVQGV